MSAKYLDVGGKHFARHDRLPAEAGVEARKHADLPARIAEFLRERRQAGTLKFRGRGRGVSQRWLAEEIGVHFNVFRTVPGAAEALEPFNAEITAQAVLDRMAPFGAATEVLVALPNAGAARPKASLAEARTPSVDRLANVVTTDAETRALDYDRHEVKAFLSNLAFSRELADTSAAT